MIPDLLLKWYINTLLLWQFLQQYSIWVKDVLAVDLLHNREPKPLAIEYQVESAVWKL